GIAGNGVAENAVDRRAIQVDAVLRVAQRGGARRVRADVVSLDDVARGVAVELDAVGVAGAQLGSAPGVVDDLDFRGGESPSVDRDVVEQPVQAGSITDVVSQLHISGVRVIKNGQGL